MQRSEIQNSMEFGAEMTRASLNAAIRIGHQTIDAYRHYVVLQADSTGHLLDESVRQLLSAATENAVATARSSAAAPHAAHQPRKAA